MSSTEDGVVRFFNLTTGEVTERALDTEWGCEFARINEDYIGKRNRYAYAARIAGDTLESGFDGIIKYDLVAGTSQHYAYGPGRLGGEPIFAPKPGGEREDDGWVIAYLYDAREDRSDVVILHAQDFSADPVATIQLPARVPFGFHGSFVPDEG